MDLIRLFMPWRERIAQAFCAFVRRWQPGDMGGRALLPAGARQPANATKNKICSTSGHQLRSLFIWEQGPGDRAQSAEMLLGIWNWMSSPAARGYSIEGSRLVDFGVLQRYAGNAGWGGGCLRKIGSRSRIRWEREAAKVHG